jgi:hypothetical protein
MVKSRFNFYGYFSILASVAFFVLSITLLVNQKDLKTRGGHIISSVIPGVIILLLSIFLFYILAKVIYVIKIGESFISIKGIFKNRHLEVYEIKSINLFSRQNLAGTVTIATLIELEDGNKLIIADPFYRNIDAIKTALDENFREKIIPYHKKRSAISRRELFDDEPEKFAGNPIISMNGILFFGLAIALSIAILSRYDPQATPLFLLIPIGVFYLLFGSQLNYFVISKDQFIVRNHFLFWINRVYDIDNIVQAGIEFHHKRSDALRITTADFKTRLYCAGSLREKNWIDLRKKLEDSGILFI